MVVMLSEKYVRIEGSWASRAPYIFLFELDLGSNYLLTGNKVPFYFTEIVFERNEDNHIFISLYKHFKS